jgi:hypothetical protein
MRARLGGQNKSSASDEKSSSPLGSDGGGGHLDREATEPRREENSSSGFASVSYASRAAGIPSGRASADVRVMIAARPRRERRCGSSPRQRPPQYRGQRSSASCFSTRTFPSTITTRTLRGWPATALERRAIARGFHAQQKRHEGYPEYAAIFESLLADPARSVERYFELAQHTGGTLAACSRETASFAE